MSDPATAADIVQQTAKLSQATESFLRMSNSASGGNANFNMNMGGIGVWICSTCCVVMLLALIFFALDRVNQRQDNSDLREDIRELRLQNATMQAYINAGYGRPPEEEKK